MRDEVLYMGPFPMTDDISIYLRCRMRDCAIVIPKASIGPATENGMTMPKKNE